LIPLFTFTAFIFIFVCMASFLLCLDYEEAGEPDRPAGITEQNQRPTDLVRRNRKGSLGSPAVNPRVTTSLAG
jgi:hypothetical protein